MQSLQSLEFGNRGGDSGYLMNITSPSKEYTLMPFLSGFTSLNMLQIDPFFYLADEFCQLAIMDTLQHLSINLDHVTNIFELDQNANSFLHLQKLEFAVTEIKLALWLLSCKGFTQLEYLHVIQIDGEIWDLKNLFELLGIRFLDSQLRSIRVSGNFYWIETEYGSHDIPDYRFDLTPDTFIPLFPLRNLTELSIESADSPSLDDDLLQDMANSWPCLKVLQFGDKTTTSTPKSKLTSLLLITKACPLLEELMLRIDACQIPEFSDIANVLPSSLHKLNVCTSLAKNVEEIASFITVAFPNPGCFDYFRLKDYELDELDPLDFSSQSVWLHKSATFSVRYT